MKRWDWGNFVFILILAGLGLASNQNIKDFSTWLFSVIIFGFPLGLLFAYMGKKE